MESFSNNAWRVYWQIAHDLIILEKKNVLDDITVGLYLEKHPQLKKMYEKYGGYETIFNSKEYVNDGNLEGNVNDLNKWNAVLDLAKRGFGVRDRLSEFCDMTAEDIYNEYEAFLNHTFVNIESNVKSYNAAEGVTELINLLNEGVNVGLPLHNCKVLNREISGLNLGNIYGLGALSGVGKSTTAMNWILPSIIEHDEKIVFIINEEDQTKVQRELLIWVANNVFKIELHKYILRDGKFSDDELELLKKCAEWIESKKESMNIIIIPLERYTTSTTIKIIKKYASMGVKYFCIDTLKESADSKGDKVWLDMTRDMVKLYDVIKPSNKNVCLFVTYQLGKSATKKRYFTNDEIGMAKSIVDTMSVNLMIRNPYDDEYSDGKNPIKGLRLEGKHNSTRIPFQLDKNKNYIIIFVTKNRFGVAGQYQILAEYDLSLNKYRELGICYVPQDF